MIKLTKQDMIESRKRNEVFRKNPGDPTITQEEAMNLAIQMKKIQDEELKNPKPTHEENGLLIMDDDPFEKN